MQTLTISRAMPAANLAGSLPASADRAGERDTGFARLMAAEKEEPAAEDSLVEEALVIVDGQLPPESAGMAAFGKASAWQAGTVAAPTVQAGADLTGSGPMDVLGPDLPNATLDKAGGQQTPAQAAGDPGGSRSPATGPGAAATLAAPYGADRLDDPLPGRLAEVADAAQAARAVIPGMDRVPAGPDAGLLQAIANAQAMVARKSVGAPALQAHAQAGAQVGAVENPGPDDRSRDPAGPVPATLPPPGIASASVPMPPPSLALHRPPQLAELAMLSLLAEAAMPLGAGGEGAPGLAGSGMPATYGLTALTAGPPAAVPQLAAQLAQTLLHRSDGSTELALSPEELGSVRVTLQPDALNPDRLVVMLTFERPETLDLFRRHADQLAEALRHAGYAGADIGFGQPGGGGNLAGRNSDPDAAPPATDSAMTEATGTARDPLPLRTAPASALDLRL